MYDECLYITKSVLTLHPTHREALKLSEYLMNRQYDKVNDKTKKHNSRPRFGTVSITKSSIKQNKPKHKKVFSVNISLFHDQRYRKNDKHSNIVDDVKEGKDDECS
eukprot:157417_1